MFLTFIEGSMEVELMVTKRDDDRPTDDDDDRVNIGQSASGRWTGRVLQKDCRNFSQKTREQLVLFRRCQYLTTPVSQPNDLVLERKLYIRCCHEVRQ